MANKSRYQEYVLDDYRNALTACLSLRERRDELSAELAVAEQQLTLSEQELSTLAAMLRLRFPEVELESVPPIPKMKPVRTRWHTANLVRTLLRVAKVPLTRAEILKRSLEIKKLPPEDVEERAALAESITNTLKLPPPWQEGNVNTRS